MKDKTIELELRAEILPKEIKNVKNRLEKLGALHSHTKRLSIMCFGAIGQKKIDIRVRVTNGQNEVAIKFGAFGAHDRIEIAQSILPEQFIGFVKMFTQFCFAAKIGERETFNYVLPNNITASLVIAGTIAYMEFEKMSLPKDIRKNTDKLKKLAKQLSINLLKSENEFDELCSRLDEKTDWPFNGSKDEYNKLEMLLNSYTKIKSG